jgi:hypothetical protein
MRIKITVQTPLPYARDALELLQNQIKIKKMTEIK